MLLNKIIVNNLGVFSGRHVIDLTPRVYKEKVRPIILFGGMNGSGKTTIFDAIKLCFYGAEAFESTKDAVYKKYLKEKINSSNNSLIKAANASIAIEFEHSSFGEKNTYCIERYWEKQKETINEYLNIKKNGSPIDEIDKTNWQTFIKELIPVGLSQLFFFDGEKIQKIMNDEDNSELKKSIMTLLGLDLIERLQSDLKIYKRELHKKSTDSGLVAEIESVELEMKQVTRELHKHKEALVTYQGEADDVEERIKACENRINEQGGGYFERKDDISNQKNEKERELETLTDEIRKIASGLLPLAIVGKLASKLRNQLIAEEEHQTIKNAHNILMCKLGSNQDAFNRLRGATVSNSIEFQKSLVELIDQILSTTEEAVEVNEIHNLSINQINQIRSDIAYATTELPAHLIKITKHYEATYRELQDIHSKLAGVPSNDLMQPLYEKLALLNKELGGFVVLIKQENETIATLEFKLIELDRKTNKIHDKILSNKSKQTKLGLIEKTNAVFAAYYKKLSKSKIMKLQSEFFNIFLSLHRKEDLISKIEINPDTFDIYIYDKYGSKINKNRLSSGELEIYAISMVWALARNIRSKSPFCSRYSSSKT